MPSYDQYTVGGGSADLARDRSRAVFGQVMGLVALTAAFAALGAYIGRNFNAGFFFILIPLAAMIGVQWAVRRGQEQMAIVFLLAMGLLLGIACGGIIHYYSLTNPTALYQAAGTTAVGVAGLGAIGYTTQHDLSGWLRPLMFALIGLLLFGLIACFIAIPGGNIIYAVAGLAIFSFLTVFDFWRLQRAGPQSAVIFAALIFLDVFNIFMFLLQIFGGGGNRR